MPAAPRAHVPIDLRTKEMKKRILILLHQNDQDDNVARYVITYLSRFWEADGHEVIFTRGTGELIPADVVVVHVDLSVVPDEYLEFAGQYPAAVNANVGDIRKSTISRQTVKADDSYDGVVIVKSNLNYAGRPERRLAHSAAKQEQRVAKFRSSNDYLVFRSVREVPAIFFESDYFIIEKFLPEKNKGLFSVRFYQFLGDRESFFSMSSKHPIVNGSSCESAALIEPSDEIRLIRQQLKMDYGKLDYVIRDGKVVLLDVNKTTGYWRTNERNRSLDLESIYRDRAQGIYSYLS